MADAAADAAVQTGGGNKGGLVAALGPIAVAAAAYFGLKPTGVWVTALGAVVAALCSVACVLWGVAMRYYTVTLQDAKKPKTARHRKPYTELRAQLMAGGRTAALYERWLMAALARVDAFFGDGDAAAANHSLWPRAFGLTHPAPLWTATSFDRCLLLALIYPISVVILLWVFTGHRGPAEAALRLSSRSFWGTRATLAVALLGALTLYRVYQVTSGKVRWLALGGVGAFPVFTSTFIRGDGAVITHIIAAVPVAIAGAFCGIYLSTSAVLISIIGLVAGAVGSSVGSVLTFAGMVVPAVASAWSQARGLAGQFQLVFATTLLTLLLILPHWLNANSYWSISAPGLLFFGVLTLVNAPFDWLSLGLTRALLRRGLERRGWWPYAYAMFDAAAAVAVIAVLAVAMLLSVQWFNDAATRAGGHAALDLPSLLDGIRVHPERPEYFWVYATLLSTMIPSVLNLAIGGCSLLRGASQLRRLLLRHMPETGAVIRADLIWMPLLLTAQLFGGVVLALLVQAGLFFGVLGWVLPAVGFDLLDVCRTLATADLPGQAMHAVLGW